MSQKCPACGYAFGGEIPEPDLGEKREAETPEVDDPDYQLDVYRGETAKRRDEEKRAQANAELARALKRRRRS